MPLSLIATAEKAVFVPTHRGKSLEITLEYNEFMSPAWIYL